MSTQPTRSAASGIHPKPQGHSVPARSSWATLALAAAFVTIVLTTLVTFLGLLAAPSSVHGEPVRDTADKVWLVVIALCAVTSMALGLLVDSVRRRRPLGSVAGRAIDALALGGFVAMFALTTWRNPPYEVYPDLFVGFDPAQVMIGLALALFTLSLVLRRQYDNRALLVLSALVVAGLSILPLIQTPATFENGYDNSFTLDEILAPSTGRMPGFDYVNLYESLLGYPLALVRLGIPGWFDRSPETFGVLWLVLLQIATIAGAVLVVLQVAPRRVRWLVPLMIVPVAYLVGTEGLPYYADLPMRCALPTVLLASIVVTGMRQVGRPPRWWTPAVIGAVGGATAINNLDFGTAAAISGLIAVVMTAPRWKTAVRRTGLYAAGAVASLVTYVGIGALAGKHYHPGYVFFFVLNFGVRGIGNVDIPLVGLHTAFVFFGLTGVVIGALGARRLRNRNRVLHQAIIFQAMWLLLSLVYFSGRSLTPTLVTGSSFPAAVLFALLFAAGYPHLRQLARAGIGNWVREDWIAATLTVLVLALPLSSWARFPDLERATTRLAHVGDPAVVAQSYLLPDPTAAVEAVPTGTQLIGILTVTGSVWSERLGVPNANLFPHPMYLEYPAGADLECAFLNGLAGESLLTTSGTLDVLARSAACRGVLDTAHATVILEQASPGAEGVDWVLVSKP